MRHPLLVIFFAALLMAACQPQTEPTRPDMAVASTPVESLPVNVAFQQTLELPTPVPQDVIDAADAEYLLLTNLYERVTPSVVNVEAAASADAGFSDFGRGSGFMIDLEGHIVTNGHVVSGAEVVRVTFNDGFVTDAEVLGLDAYSDLAVLRVNVDESRLAPVTFGDSDAVRVGERAIVIGNPFGLTSSMTVGIVSGLGRQLPSAELINAEGISGFQNPNIIQVDTDINPGNSGGPLLNSRGEVIGVTTAIRTDTGVFQGVGFAVPSATVQRVIPDLIANGSVNYSWLGISSTASDNGFGVAGLAESLNLPVSAGVLVSAITPNSPASKAGLMGGTRTVLVRGREVCAGGDIIVAVNDEYITNMDELTTYLVANTAPGDTINLLVVRQGESFEIPLLLEQRPSEGVDNASTCGE